MLSVLFLLLFQVRYLIYCLKLTLVAVVNACSLLMNLYTDSEYFSSSYTFPRTYVHLVLFDHSYRNLDFKVFFCTTTRVAVSLHFFFCDRLALFS
jgi:hypothetical protein